MHALSSRLAIARSRRAGAARTRHGSATKRFFVNGGFVQVRNNVVTVLTPRAVKAEEINATAATQVLEGRGLPENAEARLKAQERARVQLRIARRIGGEPRHGSGKPNAATNRGGEAGHQ